MVILQSPQESWSGRLPHKPRQPTQTSMTASTLHPRVPGNTHTQLNLPESWNSVPALTHSPAASSHRSSPSFSSILGRRTPFPADISAPGPFKEESPWPAEVSPRFTNARAGSLKGEFEDDGNRDEDKPGPLPNLGLFLSHHESLGPSRATDSLRTLSTSPGPSESDAYSRGSSLPLFQDPITDQLNRLRMVNKKEPLPPLEGLPHVEFLGLPSIGYPGQATRTWEAPQDSHSRPCQRPPPPRAIKKRRARKSNATHCNIKYLTEELDYIRYQRVDHGLKWDAVETTFCEKFPMIAFHENRRCQGLQGVHYRQNGRLPSIVNGQLVFMENGHVEPVTIKTRSQVDRNLFTLVYMYPDRAMNYAWVSPTDRQYTAELNEDRQRQLEKGRREAIQRGTYIERLPSDVLCGCCPGEDRVRLKKSQKKDKSKVKKPKSKFWTRLGRSSATYMSPLIRDSTAGVPGSVSS